MYIEIAYYDKQATEDNVREITFGAVEKELNGVSVPIYFVPLVKNILPEGMVLSTPVNYPNGMLDQKVRAHASLTAIRKGVTAIDYVLPHSLIVNEKWDDLNKDVITQLSLCDEHGVTLRVMLEYRCLDQELVTKIAILLSKLGVEYIFPSTGQYVDDYSENILVGLSLYKATKINIITNGNIWLNKHIKAAIQSKLFGIRLKSVVALNNWCII